MGVPWLVECISFMVGILSVAGNRPSADVEACMGEEGSCRNSEKGLTKRYE